MDPQKKTWTTIYLAFGLFLTLFAFFYIFRTRSSLKANSDLVPGQRMSQIAYIVALFVKGLGLIGSAVLIIVDPDGLATWKRFSIVTGGTPGYVTAIAYCLIFFSWCSVCLEYMEKSARDFYDRTRYTIFGLVIFIAVAFIISMSFVLSGKEVAHQIEGIIASIRDIILSVAFLVYLIKVFRLFDSKCPSCSTPEMRFFSLCILLITSLFLRFISIALYIMIIFPVGGKALMDEFGGEYLAIFLVEFTITELMPLMTIGSVKLFCSEQDEEAHSSDQGTTFMAFQ